VTSFENFSSDGQIRIEISMRMQTTIWTVAATINRLKYCGFTKKEEKKQIDIGLTYKYLHLGPLDTQFSITIFGQEKNLRM